MRKPFLLITCWFLWLSGFGQDGQIVSKTPISLNEISFWESLNEQDTLTGNYAHLTRLNFYQINYLSDQDTITGYLIEPKGAGKHPVVIFNRGGNRTFAQLTIESLISFTALLADQGYVIIGSNYRKKDEFGGKEIKDVLNLFPVIGQLENTDTSRMGMLGWSRGGLMTYLTLKHTDRIKTAIVGNGPSNMFQVIAERPEIESRVLMECVPGYQENKTEELTRRSPDMWANKLSKNTSLLILYGSQDKRVNPNQAKQIHSTLTKIGYQSELKGFETDHFFSDHRDELNQVMIDWFNEHLK
ncbi:MAG: prolyl oligopeptidase family serine peptidase [Flavobacteriales bacterium]|nr:prolyl oligopeptidase family serine peptidase [Flavobacteriales bacterium]